MMKYPEDFVNKIIYGDCLVLLKEIPDNSIDLILTDPPYGHNDMIAKWERIFSDKKWKYKKQSVQNRPIYNDGPFSGWRIN